MDVCIPWRTNAYSAILNSYVVQNKCHLKNLSAGRTYGPTVTAHQIIESTAHVIQALKVQRTMVLPIRVHTIPNLGRLTLCGACANRAFFRQLSSNVQEIRDQKKNKVGRATYGHCRQES